ncbi:MAG: FAD binding domain-containing protein [Candidatus Electryonea clarkiae]|nr:FAD binding domain-containing protein [Candidatus Electryonea clarkiae]MDP8287136.1 FAD binding domain-containing protein [Candidatus Electryonea clarkiae]
MNFNVASPETNEELFEVIAANQGRNFRFGAGCTDLLIELKKQPEKDLTVINLGYLNDPQFNSIENNDGSVRIGALVTANRITSDLTIQERLPVLYEAANQLASGQIRQVATIGGNLCTASPAGDMACALVALKAECEILSANGKVRVVPIEDFFTGVRKTDLKENEILRSVQIPVNNSGEKVHSGFIKVGVRRSMECSVVSLAYHIQITADDIITLAGIAIGSVAPTIKFASSACEYLTGKRFSEIGSSESEEFATKILEYASPISDIRASAWYREEVLFNISKSIFE